MLLVTCFYYLYNWLYGASDVQDLIIWGDPTVGLATGNSNVYNTVPYIYSGGEYTVSVWIYVTKWNSTSNKPFLTLSGGGNQFHTLVLFLGKTKNKLGVRVSTSSDSLPLSFDNNVARLTYSSSTSATATTNEYSKMLSSSIGYRDEDMPMGDIEEVNLQRWVNITVVMMGKTLDVYIDGKLSRSAVLGDFFKGDNDNNNPSGLNSASVQKITLGGPDSFIGYIGLTRAANMAYTPDRVYANYQAGPFLPWSLNSMDPSQYSLTIKRNATTIFSTASTTT